MLEVGRVNEPVNHVWLKMGLNRKPQVQKVVPGFFGFGKGVDSFPLSFPLGCSYPCSCLFLGSIWGI